ncbi:hypothetical protein [Pelobium manganitolerans]|uniref:hypothetical protein n=1 Tax=Pelobium manganitolerans TaxID=1842495 RepID=UPI003FA34F65
MLKQLEQKLAKPMGKVAVEELARNLGSADEAVLFLIAQSTHTNDAIAFRASWVLERVLLFYPEVFKDWIGEFLTTYPIVKGFSAQRHYSKMLLMLYKEKLINQSKFSEPQFELCLEVSFDWLLNPKTPVAVQCNIMDAIALLAKHYLWAYDELQHILQQKLVSNSPALAVRAKRLLAQKDLKK